MNDEKQSLDATVYLSRASQDTHGLDAWINQHLEAREQRLSKNNPFVWHSPSANDLRPTTVEVVDLDKPINFK